MTTTEQRLADALRALYTLVLFDGNHADEMAKGKQLKEAREALAAYDAQQAQAHDVAAGAWSANAGSVWDHTGKWIADCNRVNAARIVACVNACAGMTTNEVLEFGAPGELGRCAQAWVAEDNDHA